jgi:hypothetical protein
MLQYVGEIAGMKEMAVIHIMLRGAGERIEQNS